MTERYQGILKGCQTERGFGFVKVPSLQSDVFIHAKYMPGKQQPVDGQKIEFSVEETEKGPQARKVKVLFTLGPTPYTFVPVQVEKSEEDGYSDSTASTFEVPGHDGAQIGSRISGKLKLTLTAHTPLLVGARRITLQDNNRNVVEPWRLNDEHKSVVLAGSSLKGMIRHYLSALLNAPMERVYEQYFSYRPNLAFAGDGGIKFEPREAVIEKEPDQSGEGMKVRLLGKGRQAIFVRSKAIGVIKSATDNGLLPEGTEISELKFKKQRIFRDSRASWRANIEYQLLRYNGGISGIVDDKGQGEFSRLHGENGGRGTGLYKAVLAPTNGESKIVQPHIVKAYQKTQQELADTKHGHSSSRNPIIGNDKDRAASSLKDAKALKLLKPGTLIYVEVDNSGNVVSFGHHFRYRWGYRDTVRKLDRAGKNPRVRPELSVPEEPPELTEDGYAASLTAARALFGYAADEELHGKVFSDSFQRLAGRVSLNHAVEVLEERKTREEHRFVHDPRPANDSDPTLLPLKELGSPKASAVEFYIQQRESDNEQGRLTTYGDLVDDSVPASRLAGRKFYRHQPVDVKSGAPYLAHTKDEKANSRAPLVHCVSQPGAQFRFTLRFQDLDEVELGALLFVLGIQHADQFKKGTAPPQELVDTPKYALKLGYARPLGFGSVTCALEKVELLSRDGATANAPVSMQSVKCPTEWRQTYVQKFLDKARDSANLPPNLDICLDAWSYAGRSSADYPREDDNIFTFHTDLRRAHAKSRRLSGGGNSLTDYTELVKPETGGGNE